MFPAISKGTCVTQSLLIGALAAAIGLMLCYVYAESRRLALNATFWVALACVLNIPGFRWLPHLHGGENRRLEERAAVPCVYGGEAFLVTVMAIVPLIYTEALPKAVWTEVLHAPAPPPAAPAPLATQAGAPCHTGRGHRPDPQRPGGHPARHCAGP